MQFLILENRYDHIIVTLGRDFIENDSEILENGRIHDCCNIRISIYKVIAPTILSTYILSLSQFKCLSLLFDFSREK